MPKQNRNLANGSFWRNTKHLTVSFSIFLLKNYGIKNCCYEFASLKNSSAHWKSGNILAAFIKNKILKTSLNLSITD